MREQKASSAQELPPLPRCVRCCEPPDQRFSYSPYQLVPQINVTILKGEGQWDPALWQCLWLHLQSSQPMLPGLPASPQG